MNSKLEGTGKRKNSQRSPKSSGSSRSPTSSGSQAPKRSPRFRNLHDDIKHKILSLVLNDARHMQQFRIRDRMFEQLKHILPNLNFFPLKSSASVALKDIAPKHVNVNKLVQVIKKYYESASDDDERYECAEVLEQLKDIINDISDDTIPEIEDQGYIDNPRKFYTALFKFFSDPSELDAIIKCYKIDLHYLRMKEEYTSILWKPTPLKKQRVKGGKKQNK
tara:strand:- start:370 stop:1032 length:663 start_codon:yes stop_codon:yes gene_type:complete